MIRRGGFFRVKRDQLVDNPVMRPITTLALLATFTAGSAAAAPCARDGEFGTQGVARASVPGSRVVANAIARDPQGRYLVAISGDDSTTLEFVAAVARYERNGTLDTTFGNGGFARLVVGGNGSATASVRDVVVDAAGNAYVLFMNGLPQLPRIARFTAQGQFDTGFGVAGFASASCNGAVPDVAPTELLLDAQGRFLVAARSGNVNTTIVRVRPDGTPDPGFGTANGCATFGLLGRVPATVLPRGTGYELVGIDAFVWTFRVDASGARDTSYGANGLAQTSVSGLTGIGGAALQQSRVVLYGTGPIQSQAVFARLGQDGSLDATFGSAGVRVVDFPSVPNGHDPRGISVSSTGRLAGASYDYSSGIERMLVARTGADGEVSAECNAGAGYQLATAAPPDGKSNAFGVLYDGDRVLAVGLVSDIGLQRDELGVLAITPEAQFRGGFE